MISNLWGLAVKTMWVKKLRTLFSIVSITLSVGLLCAVLLLQEQMDQALEQKSYEQYGHADLIMEYRSGTIGSNGIKAFDEVIISKIINLENIEGIGLTLDDPKRYKEKKDDFTLEGLSYTGVDDSPLTKAYYRFEQSLDMNDVVLSASLANRLDAGVNDTVVLPLQSGKRVEWTVAEIIPDIQTSDGKPMNKALFHLASLQQIMGLEGYINPVIADVKPGLDKQTVISSILMDLSLGSEFGIVILDSLERERSSVLNFKIMSYILAVIVCIISIVLYIGLLQTSIRERLTEMAIIRSLGGSEQQLRKTAMVEAAIIGFIGVSGGVALGLLINQTGVRFLSGLLQIDMIQTPVNGLGLAMVAMLAWLTVIAVSLVPAWRASIVDPIRCFRQAVEDDPDESRGRIGLFTGLVFAGIAMIVLSMSFRTGSNGRALWSSLGGLIWTIGILQGTFVVLNPVLRLIASCFGQLRSGAWQIVLKHMAADRKQSAFIILLISLPLTVFIPVNTIMTLSLNGTTESVERKYVSDMLIYTEREAYMNQNRYHLPANLISEINNLPGVQKVIPISGLESARLIDYDFSVADPEWISVNNVKNPGAKYPDYMGVSVIATDIHELSDLGLIPQLNIAINQVVLPEPYAEHLGIKVGDPLKLVMGEEQTIVTVGAIIQDFEFLDHNQLKRIILVDRSHMVLRPYFGTFEKVLVKADMNHRSEIYMGLSRLQHQFPDLRWGDKQTEMDEMLHILNQRMGFLWAVAAIVLIMSMMGMFNAQSASIHAKRREYAILRAIHLTPMQMLQMVLMQSMISAVLAVFLGLLTGAIMTFGFYNALGGGKAFGDLTIPWIQPVSLAVLILTYSVFISLPMAIKLARMKIVKALTME
jgi:ABC-type lipoprotein release transport system permease subunit